MTSNPAQIALSERFGWIALDFVNTRVVMRSGAVDAFDGVDSLLSWMDLAHSPGWSELKPLGVTADRILHSEAVRLRVAIDTLLTSTAAGQAPEAPVLHALGRAVAWTRNHPGLAVDPSGALAVEPIREPLHAAAALGPIAEDAIRLVGAVAPVRLRRCRAHGCLRWFADTSKGGRRSWCSMATCGNRAKAARYRARHEGDVDAA